MRQRPELAALVAEAIGCWSDVQFRLAVLLSALTGAAADQCAAMFFALTGSASQTAALDGAGQMNLPEDELALFNAVLMVARACEKERNKLAHWTWGHSAELPDALLLIDPKHWARKVTRVRVKTRRPGMITAEDFTIDRREVLVYRKADLKRIIRNTNRADALIAQLDGLLMRERHWPTREPIYRQLCNEPEIREALSRQHGRRKSNPKAPRPPRGRGRPGTP